MKSSLLVLFILLASLIIFIASHSDSGHPVAPSAVGSHIDLDGEEAKLPPVPAPASPGYPDRESETRALMAKMTDADLLNRADKLLSGKKISQIPTAHGDEAAMYLREFSRRHPNSADKHAKRTGDRLTLVRVTLAFAEAAAALDSNPPRDEAQIACRMEVKRNLKAPSTADFQSYNDDAIKYLGKGKFHIQTQADAQNSFGAKLRSTFDCQVQCLDKDHCIVHVKEL